jgi:hydrogenase 3 maturation protease
MCLRRFFRTWKSSGHLALSSVTSDEWMGELSKLFSKESAKRVTLLGLGNPIKSDDSLGLYIITKLRRKYGANPNRFVKIILPTSLAIERATSKINYNHPKTTAQTLIVFDAIESNLPAGSIIFTDVRETKYGFFATHNIPIRLVTSSTIDKNNTYVLGVQPKNIDVGEILSDEILVSSDLIVRTIGELIEGVS